MSNFIECNNKHLSRYQFDEDNIRKNFPDAEQVIDKFHVKKVLTDALDKVRKQEQKDMKGKKELFAITSMSKNSIGK